MVNGNNHAKKILIDDVNSSVKKAEEGSAGDIAIIGEVACKTAKIVVAIFEGNYRTVEDCDVIHKMKVVKVKLGIASFDVPIPYSIIIATPSLICCGVCIAMVGKSLNWW